MSYSSFELLDHSRPIVVFGRDGQVGRALQVCLKDFKVPTVFLGRAECDLTSESSIVEVLNRYQPQVIINAAAYTLVDKAESERDFAFAINAEAPRLMAQYIVNVAHGVLVHFSTDYVFADTKKDAYLETDPAGPAKSLSVYGQSKLAGEIAIEKIFNIAFGYQPHKYFDQFSKYFILRSSWMYGDGSNFIRTILHLAAERNQLKVVADQVGVPTSAQWLAETSVLLASRSLNSGIYHAVPEGEVSWHTLAEFVVKTAAMASKEVQIKVEDILPIPSTEYPLAAPRPYNSRLNHQKFKKALEEIAFIGHYPHWQDQVRSYVKNYVKLSFKR